MTRNIVLLCLDTVRKDYFDFISEKIPEQSDLIIDDCRAASSWSVPSHASIFTGVLPHRHGVHSHSTDFTNIDRSDTFIEDLAVERSVGISANHFASSIYGFDTFFDDFYDINPDVAYTEPWNELDVSDTDGNRYINALKQAYASDYDTQKFFINEIKRRTKKIFTGSPVPQLFDSGAKQVTNQIEAVASATEEPFFVFANLMDAHQPHEPQINYKNPKSVPRSWSSSDEFYEKKWGINLEGPEEHSTYLERYRALYASSIEYMDRTINEMVSRVDKITSKPTTYIVTADHGENLGYSSDGDLFEHTSSLSEGVLHVPLNIIHAPITSNSFNNEGYFSHLDLGKLIVALHKEDKQCEFDKPPVAESVGISPGNDLLPEEKYDYWDRAIRAAYHNGQKYIWDNCGQKLLYNIVSNRPNFQEELNEVNTVPDRLSDLFDIDIDDYKQKSVREEGSERELDNSSKERLHDLGYL